MSAYQQSQSATSRIAASRLTGPIGRPDNVAIGVIVWLASELMFFSAVFAVYFTLRNVAQSTARAAGEPSMWTLSSGKLNFAYAAANTLILVLSSVTCQLGVHAAERARLERIGPIWHLGGWGVAQWYRLTIALGAIFVLGQGYEYISLIAEGSNIGTNAYFSAFFLATGFHGLHVIGGLIAFTFVLARVRATRVATHEQTVSAMAVSYYWHFVDAIWIVLFFVLYVLR